MPEAFPSRAPRVSFQPRRPAPSSRRSILMPEITGWSHVSLSVRDRAVSAAWYGEVFGFKPLAEMNDEDGYVRTLLLHDSGVVLGLQQHDANSGDGFAPQRTGLDHMSFGVASREELDAWSARFTELGVTQSPIVTTLFGDVLCFRDPDDVQLELFFSPYA
jgi:glyoxylase I family protein